MDVALPDRTFLLTLDDGPTDPGGSTDRWAAFLRESNIHPIFFVVGERYNARARSAPAELRRLYRGMCVAWHGDRHIDHAALTGAELRASLDAFVPIEASLYAEPASDHVVTHRLFRPPFGVVHSELKSRMDAAQLAALLWDIDSYDWKAANPAQALDPSVASDMEGFAGRLTALMLIRRHGVVLMHDVHDAGMHILRAAHSALSGSGLQWKDCREIVLPASSGGASINE